MVQHCMLELVVRVKCISALSRAVTHLVDACAVSHLMVWDACASSARCVTEGDGSRAVLFCSFLNLFLQALGNTDNMTLLSGKVVALSFSKRQPAALCIWISGIRVCRADLSVIICFLQSLLKFVFKPVPYIKNKFFQATNKMSAVIKA